MYVRRPGLRIVIVGLVVLLLGQLLVGATILLVIRAHHEQLLAVQTGSMIPTFRPGDAVLVKPVAVQSLRAGDIISYQSPQDPTVIITHRLSKIDTTHGWLTTEGDALQSSDPVFPENLLVGQVTAIIPGFGKLLDTLRRPLGLVLAIYLPATLVVTIECKRLAKRYSTRHYQLPGYR